jgi:hypothetical protein
MAPSVFCGRRSDGKVSTGQLSTFELNSVPFLGSVLKRSGGCRKNKRARNLQAHETSCSSRGYGEGMIVFTWFEYGLSRPVPSTAVVT